MALEELIQSIEHTNQELARLASFPELNPSPVFEMNVQEEITYINPRGKAVFPELMKQGVEHPLVQGLQGIQEIVKNNRDATLLREWEFQSRTFEARISFLADSQVVRVYLHDMTERKCAERHVRETARVLEQKKS